MEIFTTKSVIRNYIMTTNQKYCIRFQTVSINPLRWQQGGQGFPAFAFTFFFTVVRILLHHGEERHNPGAGGTWLLSHLETTLTTLHYAHSQRISVFSGCDKCVWTTLGSIQNTALLSSCCTGWCRRSLKHYLFTLNDRILSNWI